MDLFSTDLFQKLVTTVPSSVALLAIVILYVKKKPEDLNGKYTRKSECSALMSSINEKFDILHDEIRILQNDVQATTKAVSRIEGKLE